MGSSKRKCLRIRCHGTLCMRMALFLAPLLISSPLSFAHPMGNFSISHYSGIKIDRTTIEVCYLVDMAEIPTFQEMQQWDFDAKNDAPRTIAYLGRKAETLRRGLAAKMNGSSLEFAIVSRQVVFAAGAGNLPTMKIGLVLRAEYNHENLSHENQLRYQDNNFPGHAGWKEIIAHGAPRTEILSSTVQNQDRSDQLSNYPTNLLNAPPQQLEAQLTFRATPSEAFNLQQVSRAQEKTSSDLQRTEKQGRNELHPVIAVAQENGTAVINQAATMSNPAALPMVANRQATPRSRFTELIAAQQLGLGLILFAGVIAAGLGALHALEPGHGKTVVAAYLVGSRGTPTHAMLLGLIVTISHTAGVYLLGGITLWAQRYIVPEHVYPVLGVLSGLMIAALGFYLFLQRYVGVAMHLSHSHAGFVHSHSFFSGFSNAAGAGQPHDHGAEITALTEKADSLGKRVPLAQLLGLGITGGIVPCPAALVVLLSAVALHRIAFGLFLILAFSLGLAAVLIIMGLLMVFARTFMSQFRAEDLLFTRWLPLISAAVMSCLGVGIAVKALLAAGILQFHLMS